MPQNTTEKHALCPSSTSCLSQCARQAKPVATECLTFIYAFKNPGLLFNTNEEKINRVNYQHISTVNNFSYQVVTLKDILLWIYGKSLDFLWIASLEFWCAYPNMKRHRAATVNARWRIRKVAAANANSATVKSVPPSLLLTTWKDIKHLFHLQKNKCIALTQLNGWYHWAQLYPVYNPSYHQLSRIVLGQNPKDTEAEYIAENLFKYTSWVRAS